ncbi:MAG: DNA-processing protein DprA [Bacilli bacterium]
MKTLTAREVILYLSIKYNGNWSDIFNAVRKKERIDLEEYEKITNNISCSYVTILDADYPNSLKSVYRPPFVLFYYGDLSLINKQTIGVIGPRENTKYAKENCESIVNELSSKLVIVSGLAKGIDSIAHQACVNAGGKTIAVLGSGIDNCYPKENLLLYNIIKKEHLLISEYPNMVEPNADNFPLRNRIISGLSQSLFVVEAKKKSGTMITIGYALENGKDVFCLPHNVDGTHYCNSLIKEGAILIENAQDIFSNLNI